MEAGSKVDDRIYDFLNSPSNKKAMQRNAIIALMGIIAGIIISVSYNIYASSQVHFIMNSTYNACAMVDAHNNTYSPESLADSGNTAVLKEAESYYRGLWICCISYCLP